MTNYKEVVVAWAGTVTIRNIRMDTENPVLIIGAQPNLEVSPFLTQI
jgi:hypothetical protein